MEHKKGWNPFMEENGIEIVSESAERTVLRVIPQKKHRNPYNMIHGGLLFTMIDCAAGITARADGNAYVTQCVNTVEQGEYGWVPLLSRS